jgi:MFS family permease
MDSRTNWLLLINAALGNFLAGSASRIFSVSLPTVASSLDTTIVGISWAVIAYQISQISLSLIFGRIGDIYGRHTLFGLGLAVSSIGALLCGLSQNVTQLIAFRLFQGVGASMTQSQGRALAMEALPKESSGRAQGFMTTAFHSGVLIGPSVGGLIIDYIHWRAVFFFLIPIGLAGMVLTLINRWKGNIPERPFAGKSNGSIDYIGALLLIAATVALIACVDHRIMESLPPAMRIVLAACFVFLFCAFLYREWTTPSPILDLSLFRIRMFTLSSLALLLYTMP